MKVVKFAILVPIVFLLACSSKEPKLADVVDTGVVGKMIKVEGGKFMMGCSDCAVDEAPVREVTLSTFYIGEFEVLQEEWIAIMEEENPSHHQGDSLPVEQVSWNQVSTFITKLNEKTGKTFRLPTEAEWEFAARGKNQSEFPWDNQDVKNGDGCYYANFKPDRGNYTKDGNLITSKVGIYSPNSNGLYDMAGNVAEWTSTIYTEAGVDAMNDLNPEL